MIDMIGCDLKSNTIAVKFEEDDRRVRFLANTHVRWCPTGRELGTILELATTTWSELEYDWPNGYGDEWHDYHRDFPDVLSIPLFRNSWVSWTGEIAPSNIVLMPVYPVLILSVVDNPYAFWSVDPTLVAYWSIRGEDVIGMLRSLWKLNGIEFSARQELLTLSKWEYYKPPRIPSARQQIR